MRKILDSLLSDCKQNIEPVQREKNILSK